MTVSKQILTTSMNNIELASIILAVIEYSEQSDKSQTVGVRTD